MGHAVTSPSQGRRRSWACPAPRHWSPEASPGPAGRSASGSPPGLEERTRREDDGRSPGRRESLGEGGGRQEETGRRKAGLTGNYPPSILCLIYHEKQPGKDKTFLKCKPAAPTPPIGKISPSSKIAVTLEPMRRCSFDLLRDLECPEPVGYRLLYNWNSYL